MELKNIIKYLFALIIISSFLAITSNQVLALPSPAYCSFNTGTCASNGCQNGQSESNGPGTCNGTTLVREYRNECICNNKYCVENIDITKIFNSPQCASPTATPTPALPSCASWTSININGCTLEEWNSVPKGKDCLLNTGTATLNLNSARAKKMRFANAVPVSTLCSAIPDSSFRPIIPAPYGPVYTNWALASSRGVRKVCAMFSNATGSVKCGAEIYSVMPTITPTLKPTITITPPITLTVTPSPTLVPMACFQMLIVDNTKNDLDVTNNLSLISYGDTVTFTAFENYNGTNISTVNFEVTNNGVTTPYRIAAPDLQLVNGQWQAPLTYVFNNYGPTRVHVVGVTQ
jgi:hypothetical protein